MKPGEDDRAQMTKFGWHVAASVIASVIAALIVGAGAAYVTGTKIVAVTQAKLEAHDRHFGELDASIKVLDVDGRSMRTELANTRERLFSELTNVRVDVAQLRAVIEERIPKRNP